MTLPLLPPCASASPPPTGWRPPLRQGPPDEYPYPEEALAARRKPFPEALYDLVNFCQEHHPEVISWNDVDGKGFQIKDYRYFEFHLLPLFFVRVQFFRWVERQLARHRFRRDNRFVGGYCHVDGLFCRGQLDKVRQITPQPLPRPRQPEPAQPEPQPAPTEPAQLDMLLLEHAQSSAAAFRIREAAVPVPMDVPPTRSNDEMVMTSAPRAVVPVEHLPRESPFFVDRKELSILIQGVASSRCPHPKLQSSVLSSSVFFLRGLPGCGKTTLASLLARDNYCAGFFSDGMAWISCAQQPKLTSVEQLLDLYQRIANQLQSAVDHQRLDAIGNESQAPPPPSPSTVSRPPRLPFFPLDATADLRTQCRQARATMSDWMRNHAKKFLVVLDGMNYMEDVQWFDFGHGTLHQEEEFGFPHCLLVTTRLNPQTHSAVGESDATVMTIPEMTEPQAQTLWMRASGGQFAVDENYRALFDRFGRLASFVQLAGRRLSQLSWRETRLLQNGDIGLLFHKEEVLKAWDESFAALGAGPQAESAKITLQTVFQQLAWNYSTLQLKRPWIQFSVARALIQDLKRQLQQQGRNNNIIQANDILRSLAPAPTPDKKADMDDDNDEFDDDTTAVILGALTTLGLLEKNRIASVGVCPPIEEYKVSHDLWLEVCLLWKTPLSE